MNLQEAAEWAGFVDGDAEHGPFSLIVENAKKITVIDFDYLTLEDILESPGWKGLRVRIGYGHEKIWRISKISHPGPTIAKAPTLREAVFEVIRLEKEIK